MSNLGEVPVSKVTIVSDYDDRTETLTGVLKDIELSYTNDLDGLGVGTDHILNTLLGRGDYRYFVKGEFIGEYQIKVEKKLPYLPVTVTRTATVEAEDRTSGAFEKARVLVGAPTNAKIRVGDNWRESGELVFENLDVSTPVVVEFRWKEEV